jgi:hypothetical protein
VAVRPESQCKVEMKERSRLEDEDSGEDDDNEEEEDDDDVGLAEEEEEEEEETFLVCVHNVSPEIPYAILKGRVTDTAKDILLQALLKVRLADFDFKFSNFPARKDLHFFFCYLNFLKIKGA